MKRALLLDVSIVVALIGIFIWLASCNATRKAARNIDDVQALKEKVLINQPTYIKDSTVVLHGAVVTVRDTLYSKDSVTKYVNNYYYKTDTLKIVTHDSERENALYKAMVEAQANVKTLTMSNKSLNHSVLFLILGYILCLIIICVLKFK
jgi:hypothetical protein